MWFQYTAQNWVEAADIYTAVERLGCELEAISFDRLHAANYDLDYCFDSASVNSLMEESKRYCTGADLCRKYLYGILNIKEFCEQMVEAELTDFIYSIHKYLPLEIIENYRLDQYNKDVEEDEDGEESDKGEDVCG